MLIETGNQKDGEKSYLKVHMGHVSHTDISGGTAESETVVLFVASCMLNIIQGKKIYPASQNS